MVFVFVSLLSFLCFFNRQKPVFPLEKGIFCLFSMFLFLSPLTFFGLPLFLFLFLSLSFSCLSFFLLVLFFAFFLFFVFVSFSVFFLLCFCFMKRTTWTFSIAISFFWNIFSLFWFPVLLFLSNPFFLSLFFLLFSYVFCSTSMFLVSKKQSWETPIFGQTGSCNKTVFFMNLFGKCEKLSFFPIFAKFWLMFKKHYKNGYFSTFLKTKKTKKCILRCYYLGQVDCNLKMANLAQIIIPQICARNFFQKQKGPKPLFL